VQTGEELDSEEEGDGDMSDDSSSRWRALLLRRCVVHRCAFSLTDARSSPDDADSSGSDSDGDKEDGESEDEEEDVQEIEEEEEEEDAEGTRFGSCFATSHTFVLHFDQMSVKTGKRRMTRKMRRM
jgi:hypothetical protein